MNTEEHIHTNNPEEMEPDSTDANGELEDETDGRVKFRLPHRPKMMRGKIPETKEEQAKGNQDQAVRVVETKDMLVLEVEAEKTESSPAEGDVSKGEEASGEAAKENEAEGREKEEQNGEEKEQLEEVLTNLEDVVHAFMETEEQNEEVTEAAEEDPQETGEEQKNEEQQEHEEEEQQEEDGKEEKEEEEKADEENQEEREVEAIAKKVVFVETATYSRIEFLDVQCQDDACEQSESVPNMNYKMDHPKRGVAIIFNNGTFNSVLELPDREGYKEEGEKLKEGFAALGLDVRYYLDLTVQNIVTVLSLVIREGHADADCISITFMTHGNQQPGTTHDIIYGKDGPLWVHNIIAKFNGEGCSSLRGKPKLFFIEASRGSQVDSGVRAVDTETDASKRRKTIPLEADILLAYSTVSGYTSHPNDPSGSPYIRALARTLTDHGRTKDIHWLLTRVSNLVADEFESTSVDREMNRKRQMPTYTSTLRKVLRFPEHKKDDSDFFL